MSGRIMTGDDLQRTLHALPLMLRERRQYLQTLGDPGVGFGVERAAKLAGVSDTAFYGAEKGKTPGCAILAKLLFFIADYSPETDEVSNGRWASSHIRKITIGFSNGDSDRKLAKDLNRSIPAIQRRRAALGLLRRKRRTPKEMELIRARS